MKKQDTQLAEIILVGLTARTNNKNEMDPTLSKIGPLAGKYWGEKTANHICHRSTPGVTYSAYTDYESDENGEYTYFVGEAVSSIEGQDLSQFDTLVIPASDYKKFTTEPGKMPEVVISAWQKIWAMDEKALEGRRKYVADFEVYDERAADLNNAIIDIYIGMEQ